MKWPLFINNCNSCIERGCFIQYEFHFQGAADHMNEIETIYAICKAFCCKICLFESLVQFHSLKPSEGYMRP